MTAPGSSTPGGRSPPPAPDPADDRIRVLVCDDSALIRGVLCRILQSDPSIIVVGRAANGAEALAAVAAAQPEVVVLDIEMPVMDGLTALPRLLARDPSLKVLMASTLTTRGADIALHALRLGAADYVPKPSTIGAVGGDARFRQELLEKIRGLARLRRLRPQPPTPLRPPVIGGRPAPRLPPQVIAIGSSTGGPQALFTLFQALGRRLRVPVLVTQHMPAAFTRALAEHIDRLGGPSCAEAVEGEALRPGHVHLAPGDHHLTVRAAPDGLRVALSLAAPENFCRPAVDPMLRSLAACCGPRTLAVILTGMGQDGLRGAEQLVGAGGTVLAQDEASSVVWGMPRAVAEAGLCHAVLPLPALAPKLLELTGTAGR